MAGTTTKRPVTSRSSAKAPEAPKEDPKVKALEAKVAQLEASLASLAKSMEQLKSAPVAVSSGSKDLELRSQLKEYFKTMGNRKVDTVLPNID